MSSSHYEETGVKTSLLFDKISKVRSQIGEARKEAMDSLSKKSVFSKDAIELKPAAVYNYSFADNCRAGVENMTGYRVDVSEAPLNKTMVVWNTFDGGGLQQGSPVNFEMMSLPLVGAQEESVQSVYQPVLPYTYRVIFNDVCSSRMSPAESIQKREDDYIWNGNAELTSNLDGRYKVKIIKSGAQKLTTDQIIKHIKGMCSDSGVVNHVMVMETIEHGDIILSGTLVEPCLCGSQFII